MSHHDHIEQIDTSSNGLYSHQQMGASTLVGRDVFSQNGEYLGGIKEIILDITNGKIGYAVICSARFLGISDRLNAVPWQALLFDFNHQRFVLDSGSQSLDSAPFFDKDN